MLPYAKRFVLPLICSCVALVVANNAYATLGDIVAQYTFPASALVMSPTRPQMYATIPSQNSIAIINTNTLAVEDTVFVGSGPSNLAFSPDGSKAYIANGTSNFVVVFNTQTRTVVNSFLLSEQPQDLVFGTLNRLWVLGQTQIFQINATTGASTGPSINAGGPLQISPDRNTIYCSDSFYYYKYDVSGTTPVLLLQTPGGGCICTGNGGCVCGPGVGSGADLTLSHNGNFICSIGEQCDQIPKFRTSDFAIVGSFNTGSCPSEVTFSPDDQVMYSVHTQGQIDVFNANTFLSTGTISASGQASELTVDSTGRYLFAGYTDSSTGFTGTRVFDTGREPYAPTATTNPATYVTSFSASLNGSVNPRGLATAVHFQYGTTTSYGHATPVQIHNGNTAQTVRANISGLAASTTYHFRVVAISSEGTSYGTDKTFTTLTPTGPPAVITYPATAIASFSATLNGSLDPHGLTTTVYFQYGATTSYGSTTVARTQVGSTFRNISADISGLLASRVYHFRIVATNSAGTTFGSDKTFTTLSATGPPVVATNPASYVASFSANLNGSVDPHGLTTTVYFQYGTTISYGLTSAMQTQTGNTYRNIAAGIAGLTVSTTYHFRIVATNSAGTTYGDDWTFTTLSASGPPVVITNPATNVARSSATLNGVLDPHGLTTSVHFQYGTTTSYGSTTPSQMKIGNNYQSSNANISSLSASTTYHFRIVAMNNAGTTYGADRTFTTP
jgi:YVTN family beta-propeller protein